jgi:hypothetical protein
MTLSDITARITREVSMGKYTGGHEFPTHDEIARLAHHLYEMRGQRNGHDVEDWLSTEQELTRHYQ